MKKQEKFFEEHTLGDIPEKFLQRIGALQSCELVISVAAVMERLKRLESDAKKQLRIMVSQAWAEEGRHHYRTVNAWRPGPEYNGKEHRGAIFIGSDQAFYEWCNDLFDHYWQRGGYFDVRKTTVV